MTKNEYNGWTNYETWLVKLWQDNDQGELEYWQKQSEECVRVDGEHAPTSLSDILALVKGGLASRRRHRAQDNQGLCAVWTSRMEHLSERGNKPMTTNQVQLLCVSVEAFTAGLAFGCAVVFYVLIKDPSDMRWILEAFMAALFGFFTLKDIFYLPPK